MPFDYDLNEIFINFVVWSCSWIQILQENTEAPHQGYHPSHTKNSQTTKSSLKKISDIYGILTSLNAIKDALRNHNVRIYQI